MFWPILAWFLKIDSTYSPELKKKRPCVHLRGEVKIDVHLKISTNTFEVRGSLSVYQSIDKKNDQQAPVSAAWSFQIVPKGKHLPWKNVSVTSIYQGVNQYHDIGWELLPNDQTGAEIISHTKSVSYHLYPNWGDSDNSRWVVDFEGLIFTCVSTL